MSQNVATKIAVIRHAEKPPTFGAGVNGQGAGDNESLAVRGWQRAGALTVLFAPASGPLQSGELAVPQTIFAAVVGKHSKSERPMQTVTPLAAKLKLSIQTGGSTPFGKDDWPAMATAAVATPGVVLICWQHELIPQIANQILGGSTIHKDCWPQDRYDMVWVFDLGANGAYTMTQVPQMLLAGDIATPIDTTKKAQ